MRGQKFQVSSAPSLCTLMRAGGASSRLSSLLRAQSDPVRVADAHPLGRLGARRDVAGAALFLASEQSSWVAGTVLDVAGGAVMR